MLRTLPPLTRLSGARGLGQGEAVFRADRPHHVLEAPVAIAGAVIRQDTARREAEPGEVGSGHVGEPKCRVVFLVGKMAAKASREWLSMPSWDALHPLNIHFR